MTNTTVIVPLDLSQRPMDILAKAIQLAKTSDKECLSVVFGHNDRGTVHDKSLKEALKIYSNVKLVSEVFYSDEINTSLLRNKAFEAVETDFLILLDVDIWPDIALFLKYKSNVENGIQPFYFLPCMYLTHKGTQDLSKGRVSPKALTKKFFDFSRKEFLHLASPSSITVMKSMDYIAVGRFDQRFTGHGYEDFDFMMRLANHHKKLLPCAKLMENTAARSPLFASGFRRALGRLCLPSLIQKDFSFHLYHEKPKTSRYHEARTDNYSRFFDTHNVRPGDFGESKTLIEEFIELCRDTQKDFRDYSALFENKPGHIDRFDTLKRRLRFLLND